MIYPFLLLVTDFISLLAAFTLAYIVRVQIDTRPLVREIEAMTFIKAFLLLIPIWLIINGLLGLYSKQVYEKRLTELGRLFVGAFLGMLVVIGFDFAMSETIFPARLVAVYGFVAAFLLLAIARNLLWQLKVYLFRYGYGVRGVMIVGNTEATKRLAIQLHDTVSSGYEIKAIVGRSADVPEQFKGKHYRSLEEALKALPKLGVHTIIQTEFSENAARNSKIFEAVRNFHLQYKFIPAQSEFYTGKNSIEVLQGFPVISVHQTRLVGWGRIVKRLMDFLLTLLALIPALPLILAITIIMKIREPDAPVFYRHRRVTRFNTKFWIYKFRTMPWKYCTGPGTPNKDNESVFKKMGREDLLEELEKYNKIKNDPRVTKFGTILRRTSLDELPQLFNVIKGDLSLIGPRAMTAPEAVKYRKVAGGDVVLSVKGGITGLWQVSGRSDLSFDERVQLELYYVQNWSLWMDIKILLKTVMVVIRGSGAH